MSWIQKHFIIATEIFNCESYDLLIRKDIKITIRLITLSNRNKNRERSKLSFKILMHSTSAL